MLGLARLVMLGREPELVQASILFPLVYNVEHAYSDHCSPYRCFAALTKNREAAALSGKFSPSIAFPAHALMLS